MYLKGYVKKHKPVKMMDTIQNNLARVLNPKHWILSISLLVAVCFNLKAQGWQQLFDIVPGFNDGITEGRACVQTKNGDIVAVGFGRNVSTDNDVYIVRTDIDGRVVWKRGYEMEMKQFGSSLTLLDDESIVLAGRTEKGSINQEDVLLCRIDSEGNEIWTETVGGGGDDVATDVITTQNNDIIVTGWTTSYGDLTQNVYLAKYTADGEESWSHFIAILLITQQMP